MPVYSYTAYKVSAGALVSYVVISLRDTECLPPTPLDASKRGDLRRIPILALSHSLQNMPNRYEGAIGGVKGGFSPPPRSA